MNYFQQTVKSDFMKIPIIKSNISFKETKKERPFFIIIPKFNSLSFVTIMSKHTKASSGPCDWEKEIKYYTSDISIKTDIVWEPDFSKILVINFFKWNSLKLQIIYHHLRKGDNFIWLFYHISLYTLYKSKGFLFLSTSFTRSKQHNVKFNSVLQ